MKCFRVSVTFVEIEALSLAATTCTPSTSDTWEPIMKHERPCLSHVYRKYDKRGLKSSRQNIEGARKHHDTFVGFPGMDSEDLVLCFESRSRTDSASTANFRRHNAASEYSSYPSCLFHGSIGVSSTSAAAATVASQPTLPVHLLPCTQHLPFELPIFDVLHLPVRNEDHQQQLYIAPASVRHRRRGLRTSLLQLPLHRTRSQQFLDPRI